MQGMQQRPGQPGTLPTLMLAIVTGPPRDLHDQGHLAERAWVDQCAVLRAIRAPRTHPFGVRGIRVRLPDHPQPGRDRDWKVAIDQPMEATPEGPRSRLRKPHSQHRQV